MKIVACDPLSLGANSYAQTFQMIPGRKIWAYSRQGVPTLKAVASSELPVNEGFQTH
jgi:hypothetical protein